MLPKQFYLTGTDTDVGKTVTAALLCRALNRAYWKPAQAGLDGETDTEVVARLAGVETFPERWRLKRPASPIRSRRRGALDPLGWLCAADAAAPLGWRGRSYQVPYSDEPLLWQSDLIKHLGLMVSSAERGSGRSITP